MSTTVVLKPGLSGVVLPNGVRYTGGSTVVLSDDEMSLISAAAQSQIFSSVTPSGGSGAGVASFNTRTGPVTSQSGDYSSFYDAAGAATAAAAYFLRVFAV